MSSLCGLVVPFTDTITCGCEKVFSQSLLSGMIVGFMLGTIFGLIICSIIYQRYKKKFGGSKNVKKI